MSDNKIIDMFTGAYAVLSNFYPVTIIYEDIEYPSVEHAYQAAKTLDPDVRTLIAQFNSAGAAKKAGRKIVNVRQLWNEFIRFQVMDELLALKFSSDHSDMVAALLDTGDTVLIEGNYWHDNTWGSCMCGKCGRQGVNALGRALMQRRIELQRGDAK